MKRELLLWKAYASVTTVLLAALVLLAFRQQSRPTHFDQISAQRINIVGPDGALQMVISNRQDMPEGRMDGKTLQSQGRHDGAGMIFYNSLGDEDGGLTFGAHRTSKGYVASSGLMFDQFKQDQTVGLTYDDANGQPSAGLRVWQRPRTDLVTEVGEVEKVRAMPAGAARDKAMAELRQKIGAQRLFAGRMPNETAAVVLSDSHGHARLRLEVTAAGAPVIQFLDAAGKVVRSVGP